MHKGELPSVTEIKEGCKGAFNNYVTPRGKGV